MYETTFVIIYGWAAYWVAVGFCNMAVATKANSMYFSEPLVIPKPYTVQHKVGEPGWELGIAIKALANGRINGLHIKNPTKGVVPVTI